MPDLFDFDADGFSVRNWPQHKPPAAANKQCKRVVDYINQFGSITSLEALRDLGIARLASRISELRLDHGMPIARELIPITNRFGEQTSIARYSWDAANA